MSYNGIPKVEWLGKSKKWNVLVMEYLGPSLEELLSFCNIAGVSGFIWNPYSGL